LFEMSMQFSPIIIAHIDPPDRTVDRNIIQ
jgi:hypothetical protein